MIRELPLPFIIDHMGRVEAAKGTDQEPFRALLELVKLEQCWIKVSGSERIAKPPFADAVPIAQALIQTSKTRVLWGTDFPHPNLKIEVDEADLVDLVPQIAPDPADQRRVLVENPARLYGFD
jgi:predicted TIM-barrel fold metal-dependent hydrolase